MKPNLVAIRPSELVILAIHSLGGKSGSSQKKIVRFISRKYGLSEHRLARKIRDVLAKGLDFGILTCKNGRYDLEDVPEPPSGYGVEQEINTHDRKYYRRMTGSRSKQKKSKLELDRKLSELIEQQIQQWKKERGVYDDNNSNSEMAEEESAEFINTTLNDTPEFRSGVSRVQSGSASKYRRVRLLSPKLSRKSGKKMVSKRSFKSAKAKKAGNKGMSKTRGRPYKTPGIPAKYGKGKKRRAKSRTGLKATTNTKVSAKSKPKTCHKICPKGCPKSIQRSKQGRVKEVPSQKVNNNPTNINNNNKNNNNSNSNNKNFSNSSNNNSNNNNNDKNNKITDNKNSMIKS